VGLARGMTLCDLPVIVGVGEITDRPADIATALDPLGLMAAALQRADADAGGGVLSRLDSLDVVHQTTWRYDGTAARLCERLGMAPARAVYGPTGGESPLRYLHRAAVSIAYGHSNIAAVCGAEAQYSLTQARKQGVVPPWPAPARDVENPLDIGDLFNPLALAHQILAPADVYPLYENALVPAWGLTPAEAHAESAALWARFSDVASTNPFSWSSEALTAAEIATPTADNRLIAWPYTKRMVANPAVNQGAAVLLMRLSLARELGVPEEKMVHVWGGAWANEPRDYLARADYVRSTAQDAVLEAARELAGYSGFDLLELYSCFPCVPKMARRSLGLGADVQPTVTGGLSFFGAPLNNYMTHAMCAMVRALRDGRGATGLLYGQGEFVTKHHAVVLGQVPNAGGYDFESDRQGVADTRRGPVPPLDPEYSGSATVETFSVSFGRDGSPRFGAVIARTPQGARILARVGAEDAAALDTLCSEVRSPVGVCRNVTRTGDGLLSWRF
jgi:acetyl-CoA acetyltransferase